ncbi:hypothetical protein GGF40_004168 [Coemansia sp. RSA 1286]|nr:hypothetical protein GGF40_004168 [Coemansia sp. RSA 1286]
MAGTHAHSSAPTARRSVSGDFPRGATHARSVDRRHQRAASASSLAKPEETEAHACPHTHSQFHPHLHTHLHPHSLLTPLGLRARTATATAADYASGAAGLPSPPATASSSGTASTDAGAFRPRKRSLSVGGESGSGAFFVRQVEQYGLAAVVAAPAAVCYLLAAAISAYSPENVLFYLEAEHFRSASFGGDERRLRYAKGLYKAFVSRRAPLEINISHAMRQRVLAAFRSGAPVAASMFDETQAHAYALLEADFASFRQRPLYQRMLADLGAAAQSRNDVRAQHARAVAAMVDALTATYGVRGVAPSKALLARAEAPAFAKFADLDLTSTDLRVALPAWLSRTAIRLLDTPLPSASEPSPSPPPLPAEPSKASRQRSLPRLRFRFQQDASAAAAPDSPPAPPSVRTRWDSLWGARRRKA